MFGKQPHTGDIERLRTIDAQVKQLFLGEGSPEVLAVNGTCTLVDAITYVSAAAGSITVTLPDGSDRTLSQANLDVGLIKVFTMTTTPAAGQTVTVAPTTPGATANTVLTARGDGVSYVWTGTVNGWSRVAGWTGGPAGGALVPVGNAVFVSKTGNDATALRGRFDSQFLTLAAALAVAVAGDTVYIFDGTYVEDIVVADGVDVKGMTAQAGTTQTGGNGLSRPVLLQGTITFAGSSRVSGLRHESNNALNGGILQTAQNSIVSWTDCDLIESVAVAAPLNYILQTAANAATMVFSHCRVIGHAAPLIVETLSICPNGRMVVTSTEFVGSFRAQATTSQIEFTRCSAGLNQDMLFVGSANLESTNFRGAGLQLQFQGPINASFCSFTCDVSTSAATPAAQNATWNYCRFEGSTLFQAPDSELEFVDCLMSSGFVTSMAGVGARTLRMSGCTVQAPGGTVDLVTSNAATNVFVERCSFLCNGVRPQLGVLGAHYRFSGCTFVCTNTPALEVTVPGNDVDFTHYIFENNSVRSPGSWLSAVGGTIAITSGGNIVQAVANVIQVPVVTALTTQ